MADNPHKTNNRATIVLLLAVFTIPIIVAWSAYFGGWFQQGLTVNKGELVQPVFDYTALQPAVKDQPIEFMTGAHWRIILPAKSAACLENEAADGCLLSLYIMGQVHQRLGKEKDRVIRQLYIGDMAIADSLEASLSERFVDLEIARGKAISEMNLSADYIYVADPLGNIMLRYPIIADKDAAFLKGNDIYFDLKKLLRISRIG